jgi:hypothetical protein
VELISKLIILFKFDPMLYFLFSNIKIFSPVAETPIDDSERIQLTVKRNYRMTEETSSTITVPATFIFRMLTSIYRLRNSDDMSGLDEDDDD